MSVYYEDERVTLWQGDALDVLRDLPDGSVDAVCTDPPYGLEFMGKDWDSFKPGGKRPQIGEPDGTPHRRSTGTPSWAASGNPRCTNCGGTKYDRTRANGCACDAPRFPNESAAHMLAFQHWCTDWAAECLRVLKPGGHLLAFGGSRTWHRLAAAVEDVGFEIRDTIAWLYGSGFPKSLDVSKAIDKAAGATRTVVGAGRWAGRESAADLGVMNDDAWEGGAPRVDTAPATDAGRQRQGWGTALKPGFEPIVVGRKPLAGTVAANVLEHGTGALNIDACRVGDDTSRADRYNGNPPGGTGFIDHDMHHSAPWSAPAGRWPTNVVLDDAMATELDEQTGERRSAGEYTKGSRGVGAKEGAASIPIDGLTSSTYSDSGGASRFFPTFRYEAKADAAERPRVDGVSHPTVKPLDLMRWLVRLVTPPGGTVLEPFAGSGTTVEACLIEGFRCIAIEREPDYLPLIEARIARRTNAARALELAGEDMGLFALLGEEEEAS